jgi:nicotinamide riboside kinase
MKRVVVTGSECTGKTTLTEALADRYAKVCPLTFRHIARNESCG